MDRETDNSNNIIIDLSNNINTNVNDTLTNTLQNIYQEAIGRTNVETTIPYDYLLNDPNRLRFLFNNDNTLNNVFNDINPLLLNTDRDDNIFNLNDIFSNLVNNTVNTQSNLNSVLNNSFDNDKSIYKKVLSDKGKTQLHKCLFKDSSRTNNKCPIFQLEFTDEDEIIELPCKHCFIPEAIEKWLNEEQSICPVCRFELDSKEVKLDEKNNNSEDIDEVSIESDNNNEYERSMQQVIIESLRN